MATFLGIPAGEIKVYPHHRHVNATSKYETSRKDTSDQPALPYGHTLANRRMQDLVDPAWHGGNNVVLQEHMRQDAHMTQAQLGLRLAGKVALIFGVGSVGPGWGNGRASAVLFARHGARVFGTDLDLSAAEETARLVTEEGGTATIMQSDVTDETAIAEAVERCLATYGRIDVLLNNVGGSMPGGPVEMTTEVWDHQFATNIRYVFLTCKYVLPVMERQFDSEGRGGSIINLASIAGLRHFGPNVVAYAAAKSGLIKFSQVTAVQYASKQIRVNTIVPGLMNTPLVEVRLSHQRGDGDVDAIRRSRDAQVPMGHMGEGWDVANAALFLASDESRYITATEIIVDGGLSAACPPPPAHA